MSKIAFILIISTTISSLAATTSSTSTTKTMALIAKQLPILYKTLTPDDAIENPEFCFTTIIINSNNERRSINNHQSKLYVLKHNSRRFVWNQPFDAATAALFQNFTYNESAQEQELDLVWHIITEIIDNKNMYDSTYMYSNAVIGYFDRFGNGLT